MPSRAVSINTGTVEPSTRSCSTDLDPVQARHHHVKHDRVKGSAPQLGQRLLAVLGKTDLEAVIGQDALERGAQRGIVVDDKDRHRRSLRKIYETSLKPNRQHRSARVRTERRRGRSRRIRPAAKQSPCQGWPPAGKQADATIHRSPVECIKSPASLRRVDLQGDRVSEPYGHARYRSV